MIHLENWAAQAFKKLDEEKKGVKGQKETVMSGAVLSAVKDFCVQDEEFAQAVVQGGTFGECMNAVAKGVGSSISDLDAYKKAVQFYFPGAEIKMAMTIDLIGKAAEREAFVQTHDVADMSTRQLRQAIKDLEDTKKELEETDEALEAETERREALEHELGEVKESAKTAWQEVKAAEQEAAVAKDKQLQAEKKLKQLEDQLMTAKKAEKTALEDLKKAKENPDIPESMMEQLRREAEAGAAEKATAQAQKQLDAAKAQVQEATREKEAAEAAARDAREKLVAAQKSEKISNQDVMSINVLGQQLLSIWNMIQGHRKKAVAADQGNAAPIDAFLGKVLDTMRDSMKEGI